MRVTHSPDRCEPRTLTVPRLPEFTGRVEKTEDACAVRLRAARLTVEIEKPAGRLSFFDASGKLFLAEPESGARWTEPQTVAGHALTARRQTFLFASRDDAASRFELGPVRGGYPGAPAERECIVHCPGRADSLKIIVTAGRPSVATL